MSNISTPSSGDKKREASSPLDVADTKKSRSDTISETQYFPKASESNTFQLTSDHITQISEVMKSSFQTQMSSMVNSIVTGVLKGLELKVSVLEQENSRLREQVKTLETKVVNLEDNIGKMELQNDKSNQYSRRNIIRVSNIPETEGESTDKVVMDLITAIGAEVSIDQVDRTHRLGNPNFKPPTTSSSNKKGSRPRDIIVKFVSYRARQKVYKLRSKLRDVGYNKVFINEELTRPRSDIFYKARQLVKSKSAVSAWTSDGVILIKDSDQHVHRIESASDLENYKSSHTER